MVMSTMTLLESSSEIVTLRKLCDNGDLLVEANDLSADSKQAFIELDKFRAQLLNPTKHILSTDKECNGFWHQIAGMSVA